jgi:hypothetical protein
MKRRSALRTGKQLMNLGKLLMFASKAELGSYHGLGAGAPAPVLRGRAS